MNFPRALVTLAVLLVVSCAPPDALMPLGVASQALSPTCITYAPSGDAALNQAQPTTANGSGTLAAIGPGNGGERRALMAFPVALPAGSTVTSASLMMTTGPVAAAVTAGTISVYAVTSAWSEGGVTWATQPSFEAPAASTFALPGTVNTHLAAPGVDVASTVTRWAAGTLANNGLMLDASSINQVDTRENATVGNRPSLTVCYTPPPPPAHCGNGVVDADETDVDCGGATCARCADGLACVVTSDCAGAGHFCDPAGLHCHPTGGNILTPIPSCTIALAAPGAYASTVIAYGPGALQQATILTPLPAPLSPPDPVVVVHGGAWWGGDMTESINTDLGRALVALGRAAVIVNYRLDTVSAAGIPGEVSDVRCAGRYIRANAASLGLDPVRLRIAGMSAGGTLAAMASYAPPVGPTAAGQVLDDGTCYVAPSAGDLPPSLGVYWYTPFNLAVVPIGAGVSPVPQYLGAAAGSPAFATLAPANSPNAMPIHYGSPPALLLAGLNDSVVYPTLQDGPFADQLNAMGNAGQYVSAANYAHGSSTVTSNALNCTALAPVGTPGAPEGGVFAQ